MAQAYSKELSTRLRTVLDTIVGELDLSYGWMDGGCLILTQALVSWGEGAIKAGGALRVSPRGKSFLDHAFAHALNPVSLMRVLIDGDGLQSERFMIKKLRPLAPSTCHYLSFTDCSKYAVGVPKNRAVSQYILTRLRADLGPFSARNLFV